MVQVNSRDHRLNMRVRWMNESSSNNDGPLTREEVLGWFEFGCWVVLALTPMLYYVNGPAVSTDQLVTRAALVTLSAIGAVGFLVRRLLARRRG